MRIEGEFKPAAKIKKVKSPKVKSPKVKVKRKRSIDPTDEKQSSDSAKLQSSNSQSTTTFDTGKSFSEALILTSTSSQYDKRLFIELP